MATWQILSEPQRQQQWRQRQAATCKRKKWFPTKDAAGNSSKTVPAVGFRLFAYQCGTCGGWHLTKNPFPSDA
jgi:hypothetical protein